MGSDPLADATRFEPIVRYKPGVRSSGYAFAFGLVFGLSAAQVGFVSYLFQKFGNLEALYPTAPIKRALGAALFAAIWSLLWVLGGYFVPMIPLIFAVFASAGTYLGVAAVFASTIGSSCSSTDAFQPPQFQDDCNVYTAIHALSWVLFGVCLILTGTLIYDAFIAKPKKKTVFGQ
ncbi:hypothetical protein OIO90_005317 [Microbotryomycetes sp. JL221]|nr:hypothetical protein OIO90_005317 [Microbotryomycetes sp. JL221]